MTHASVPKDQRIVLGISDTLVSMKLHRIQPPLCAPTGRSAERRLFSQATGNTYLGTERVTLFIRLCV